MPPAYLRMPTVAGDLLAFVCDDDLWLAASAGGLARRVTASAGEPAWPTLSADGRWLAYTSRDEEHPEVWVMPSAGGPARRLTWFGADTQVRGWLPDGRILFVSTQGQPFVRNLQAWAVDPEGGAPQPLGLGQVNHLAVGPGGARVIGRNTADPARWKRYRGGTAGHLWVDTTGSGDFRRLPLPGNVSCPMWLGERLWFLTDHEGTGNLYSCALDGSGLTRHTDHDGPYARHAATDGRRIVYQCAAELWNFDPDLGQTRLLGIEVPAARTQTAPRPVNAAAHLGGVALHPQGHSVAMDVRGKFVSFALWEGAVRQHGLSDGARYRHGQWLADGRTLVVVSDADHQGENEEHVELHRPDGTSVLPWPAASLGRVIELVAAPRGDHVALANHRNELWVGDTGNGQLKRADHSEAGRIDELAWSPCGGWLAYACWTSGRHRVIRLLEIASGRVSPVTACEFHDWSPAFDPDGKYLYFLSNRTFDPVYDSLQFELSFPRGARPYLVALHGDAPPPFEPAARGMADDKPAPVEGSPAPAGLTRIDLDGLERRVLPFPVDEGRFGRIAGAAGGKVLWTRLPIAGAHGRGGHKDSPGTLERFAFATGDAETLLEQADGFVIAADATTVLVRVDKRLRVVGAGRDAKHEERGDKPSREDRLASTWHACAWRSTPAPSGGRCCARCGVCSATTSGSPTCRASTGRRCTSRYAPLLPRVATRAELST
jgi:tricorn protease